MRIDNVAKVGKGIRIIDHLMQKESTPLKNRSGGPKTRWQAEPTSSRVALQKKMASDERW